jgi:hypothetical protein
MSHKNCYVGNVWVSDARVEILVENCRRRIDFAINPKICWTCEERPPNRLC